MKVLVTGSRGWTDTDAIHDEIAKLPADAEVIHGDARGADRMAAHAALARGLTVIPCPADWDRYGRGAGAIRNAAMVAMQPDLVLAFWDGISHGTMDCIKKANAKGLNVKIVLVKE